MAKKTYSDKLKDPRWQKKRLEVLNLHGFKCEKCKCETKELHVHHRFYITGREVWQYDNDVLQVLCCDCHEKEHSKELISKTIEVIPEKYKDLIEYLNQYSDNQISWFTESAKMIESEFMDEFNSMMLYVAQFGLDVGFSDVLKQKRAEENEIDLWQTINELKSQIKELKK